ncbi:MAG: hypothetical protein U0Z17_01500 [Bacteroidales bacterium]
MSTGTPVPLQLHAIALGIEKDVKVEVKLYPNPVLITCWFHISNQPG